MIKIILLTPILTVLKDDWFGQNEYLHKKHLLISKKSMANYTWVHGAPACITNCTPNVVQKDFYTSHYTAVSPRKPHRNTWKTGRIHIRNISLCQRTDIWILIAYSQRKCKKKRNKKKCLKCNNFWLNMLIIESWNNLFSDRLH